jgi:hypothetical protein
VMCDSLCVRLRESDPHVGRERESVHARNPKMTACRPPS